MSDPLDERVFAYFLENVTRPTREAIERHVSYLSELDASGRLIVCGPFLDDEGGGMVCITAPSEGAAHDVARGDPFVALGFKRYRVRELARATRENGYLLDDKGS
jgi:uncharacterized protein